MNNIRPIATGYQCGSSSKKVAITFDQETFSEIRDRAEKAETSFAEQVRLLVEWGLMTPSKSGVAVNPHVFRKPPERTPKAYNMCVCSCHQGSGIKHFIPCCSPPTGRRTV